MLLKGFDVLVPKIHKKKFQPFEVFETYVGTGGEKNRLGVGHYLDVVEGGF